MDNSLGYNIALLVVVAVVTAITRAIPYLLFGGNKKLPKSIIYLGNVLPYAIMITLVIFCIRNIKISSYPHGLPEIISIGLVVIIHLTAKNTIISIVLGTTIYMILIRTIFLV